MECPVERNYLPTSVVRRAKNSRGKLAEVFAKVFIRQGTGRQNCDGDIVV